MDERSEQQEGFEVERQQNTQEQQELPITKEQIIDEEQVGIGEEQQAVIAEEQKEVFDIDTQEQQPDNETQQLTVEQQELQDIHEHFDTQEQQDNEGYCCLPLQKDTVAQEDNFVNKPWRVKGEKTLNVVLLCCVILLLVTVFVRLFFFVQVQVMQNSMWPTYKEGEHILVRKTQTIQHGQVVVFFENSESKDFILVWRGEERLILKRVVACEGDKMWVEQQSNGKYALFVLTANTNEVLNDDYYTRDNNKVEIPLMTYETLGTLQNHIGQENALTVQEGHFFAMGDNRLVSKDSRDEDFGQIPMSHILGVVME